MSSARPSPRSVTPGSRPRRCGATSTSSASPSTTCTTTCRGSAASRSRRSQGWRTRSWPVAWAPRSSSCPALRGARDLLEAREFASIVLEPEAVVARRRRAADPRALQGAAQKRRLGQGHRARAEGGRRRSARAAARADRSRARPRAVGRDRRAPRATRLSGGSMRLYDTVHTWPRRAPRARRAPDRHVLLRADRLPANPRRQRAPVRRLDVAPPLAAGARLRRDARREHHRHQRQDLRGCARRQREARAPMRRAGTSRTPTCSASAARITSRSRPGRSRRSSR